MMSKFSSGTIVSLVEELVGGIEPIGETNYDKKCFENAQIMDEIISNLIYKMASLLKYIDSYEASKKSIGDYATDFVKGLRLNADDWIFRYELDEDEVGKLIRCKDCEWWDSESKEKYRVCHNHNTGWKADDYCSFGKLRGNEE